MAQSLRYLSALFHQERARAKFRASSLRRSKTSYRLDPKPLRAGREAWHDWQEEKTHTALAAMHPPHEPPQGASLDNPWWIFALTSDPCFLSAEERKECIALMAIPKYDAPAPDWKQIAAKAALHFAQKAARQGKKTELHMAPEIGGGKNDDATDSPVLDGRAQIFMPGYSFDSFEGWGGFELFDRRRAKRRLGKPMPPAWSAAYGTRARELWLSGLVDRAWETDSFDEWACAIAAIQEATLEAGAKACWIAPDFFARHPQAMDDMSLLESIDRKMLDHTRAKWSISESSSTRVQKNKPKTL